MGLPPAYDLLPVNVILPEDTEGFALTMNGKMIGCVPKWTRLFEESMLPVDMKSAVAEQGESD